LLPIHWFFHGFSLECVEWKATTNCLIHFSYLTILVIKSYRNEDKKRTKNSIQTAKTNSKWNRHRTELRFGSHRNQKLQKDWNELGEEHFIFSVLSELEIKEDDSFNLGSEVKLLREMVEEELDITKEMKY